MKFYFIFAILFFCIWLLEKIKYTNKNSNSEYKNKECRIYVINMAFVMLSLLLFIIGVYVNYKYVVTCKQNGQYNTGEIIDVSTQLHQLCRGYEYKIEINDNDERLVISTYSETYHSLHEKVNVYYNLNDYKFKAIIDSDFGCIAGNNVLILSLIFEVIACFIWHNSHELV